MTNTIFGILFLLIAVAIISLYSCNRNSSKSDTTKETAVTDSTATFNKMDSTANETDTLVAGEVDTTLNNTDTIAVKNDNSSLTSTVSSPKTVVTGPGEKFITDEVETNKTPINETQTTVEEESEKLSLKENTKKPTTNSGGGLKGTSALKDRVNDLKRILILGTGGGVTGAVTEYRIDDEGVIYEKNSITGSPSRKKALKVEQFSNVIQRFEALNIDALKLNDPGNIYYYVGYEQNGDIKKVTWGNVNEAVPEALKSYYEFMIAEISK